MMDEIEGGAGQPPHSSHSGLQTGNTEVSASTDAERGAGCGVSVAP